MIRAIIQYESEPDADRYQQHLDEFTVPVECSAFRHGKVFGSPFGDDDTTEVTVLGASRGPTGASPRLDWPQFLHDPEHTSRHVQP